MLVVLASEGIRRLWPPAHLTLLRCQSSQQSEVLSNSCDASWFNIDLRGTAIIKTRSFNADMPEPQSCQVTERTLANWRKNSLSGAPPLDGLRLSTLAPHENASKSQQASQGNRQAENFIRSRRNTPAHTRFGAPQQTSQLTTELPKRRPCSSCFQRPCAASMNSIPSFVGVVIPHEIQGRSAQKPNQRDWREFRHLFRESTKW